MFSQRLLNKTNGSQLSKFLYTNVKPSFSSKLPKYKCFLTNTRFNELQKSEFSDKGGHSHDAAHDHTHENKHVDHASYHMGGCSWAPQAVIRQPAPQFKGTSWWNGEFKKINLSDFKGKWVVLFFYPLDFTFVCPTEIVQFSEVSSDFDKLSKLNHLIPRLPSHWMFGRLTLLPQRMGNERKKTRRT
jgi:hypothetical protein